jgi:hypothetical protein
VVQNPLEKFDNFVQSGMLLIVPVVLSHEGGSVMHVVKNITYACSRSIT